MIGPDLSLPNNGQDERTARTGVPHLRNNCGRKISFMHFQLWPQEILHVFSALPLNREQWTRD
jgi:hypothetical protein